MQEQLKKYQDWLFKVSAYQMALSIIGIDKQTVAPVAGTNYRDERTAFLAGELFSIQTDPEIVKVLEELNADETLDGDTKRAVSLYLKDIQNQLCIPKEEYVAFAELTNISYTKWLEAKTKKDYTIFEPYLKQVIDFKKKLYGYRNNSDSIYNQMLDDFEPGMNEEKYDLFFNALKERLVPLIQKVTQAKQIDDAFLYESYEIDGQKKFMDELLKFLHFDPEWGYQNETEHPFTSWTCENDCRITTKYLENNVISALFSTIHEVGHAYYEHDVDPKYDGMILSDGISSGMHESQSRLCENYLGRTKAFWTVNYPLLQKQFPKQLADHSLDEFIRAVNVSKPSLVRTEADELTYPMHIIIRYEIERGLFNGTISTEGLDQTWANMYEKYLGVRPDNASVGILQDVHWSDGSFGYFPTYAYGSAIGAQIMHVMKKEIDVEALLENNQFDQIIAWLKQNVHRYGVRYSTDEVLLKATGEPFNVNYYLDYLEEKYTKLYKL